MVDEKKIGELMDAAVGSDLDGLDFVTQFDDDQIAKCYNGIGPEFLPPAVREKVSSHLSLFAPAALIHDMRYSKGDGSRYRFNYANWEFQVNCRKLAKRAYPWYSWRRYRALAVADLLVDAVCSDAGWVAWTTASNTNKEDK